MNLTILVSACSALIAGFALGLAFLNYRMSRKLPNENKIFEEKIKSYQFLIKLINEMTAVFTECANEYNQLLREKCDHQKAKDELNDALDDSWIKLEDAIYENSLVLPDHIVEQLYKYMDAYDMEDFLVQMTTDARQDEFEEQVNDLFDKVINAMRADLAFDKLDRGLRSRTGAHDRLLKSNL